MAETSGNVMANNTLINTLKGAVSHNCKQTCYLYDLHCSQHLAIAFCTYFGGWVNPRESYY